MLWGSEMAATVSPADMSSRAKLQLYWKSRGRLGSARLGCVDSIDDSVVGEEPLLCIFPILCDGSDSEQVELREFLGVASEHLVVERPVAALRDHVLRLVGEQ